MNFADHGLQLSRGSRALKIWLSVGFFGVPAFRTAVDRALDLALFAERHVRGTPQLELMSPASLGIVTFRRAGPDGESERDAATATPRWSRLRGHRTGTRLVDPAAWPLCDPDVRHEPHDRRAHVRDTLEWFAGAPVPDGAPSVRAPVARRADPRDHVELGGSPLIAPGELAALPLFGSLEPADLERVAGQIRRAVRERLPAAAD